MFVLSPTFAVWQMIRFELDTKAAFLTLRNSEIRGGRSNFKVAAKYSENMQMNPAGKFWLTLDLYRVGELATLPAAQTSEEQEALTYIELRISYISGNRTGFDACLAKFDQFALQSRIVATGFSKIFVLQEPKAGIELLKREFSKLTLFWQIEALSNLCNAYYTLGDLDCASHAALELRRLAKVQNSHKYLEEANYFIGIYGMLMGQTELVYEAIAELEKLFKFTAFSTYQKTYLILKCQFFIQFHPPSVSILEIEGLFETTEGVTDKERLAIDAARLALRIGDQRVYTKHRQHLIESREHPIRSLHKCYANFLEIEAAVVRFEFKKANELIQQMQPTQILPEIRFTLHYYSALCHFKLTGDWAEMPREQGSLGSGIDMSLNLIASLLSQVKELNPEYMLQLARTNARRDWSEGKYLSAMYLHTLWLDLLILQGKFDAVMELMPQFIEVLRTAEDRHGEVFYLKFWELFLAREGLRLGFAERKRLAGLEKTFKVDVRKILETEPYASVLTDNDTSYIEVQVDGIYRGNHCVQKFSQIPGLVGKFLNLMAKGSCSYAELTKTIWGEEYEPTRHENRLRVLASATRKYLAKQGLKSLKISVEKKLGYKMSRSPILARRKKSDLAS